MHMTYFDSHRIGLGYQNLKLILVAQATLTEVLEVNNATRNNP